MPRPKTMLWDDPDRWSIVSAYYLLAIGCPESTAFRIAVIQQIKDVAISPAHRGRIGDERDKRLEFVFPTLGHKEEGYFGRVVPTITSNHNTSERTIENAIRRVRGRVLGHAGHKKQMTGREFDWLMEQVISLGRFTDAFESEITPQELERRFMVVTPEVPSGYTSTSVIIRKKDTEE